MPKRLNVTYSTTTLGFTGIEGKLSEPPRRPKAYLEACRPAAHMYCAQLFEDLDKVSYAL